MWETRITAALLDLRGFHKGLLVFLQEWSLFVPPNPRIYHPYRRIEYGDCIFLRQLACQRYLRGYRKVRSIPLYHLHRSQRIAAPYLADQIFVLDDSNCLQQRCCLLHLQLYLMDIGTVLCFFLFRQNLLLS